MDINAKSFVRAGNSFTQVSYVQIDMNLVDKKMIMTIILIHSVI